MNKANDLWRQYHGSRLHHLYNSAQLAASWQHQVALCGRETWVGTGAYSPHSGPPATEKGVRFCGKCQKLAAARNEPEFPAFVAPNNNSFTAASLLKHIKAEHADLLSMDFTVTVHFKNLTKDEKRLAKTGEANQRAIQFTHFCTALGWETEYMWIGGDTAVRVVMHQKG